MIANPRPHPEWRLIVELVKELEYDTLLPHDDIATAAQLTAQSGRYYAHVDRANRELRREWQRVLVPEHGVGYRIMRPSEGSDRVRREWRRAHRRIRVGREIGLSVPTQLLTDAENKTLGDTLARSGAMESHIRTALRDTRPALTASPLPDTPKMLKG